MTSPVSLELNLPSSTGLWIHMAVLGSSRIHIAGMHISLKSNRWNIKIECRSTFLGMKRMQFDAKNLTVPPKGCLTTFSLTKSKAIILNYRVVLSVSWAVEAEGGGMIFILASWPTGVKQDWILWFGDVWMRN